MINLQYAYRYCSLNPIKYDTQYKILISDDNTVGFDQDYEKSASSTGLLKLVLYQSTVLL